MKRKIKEILEKPKLSKADLENHAPKGNQNLLYSFFTPFSCVKQRN